jgi:ribonucleotide monophosphatase NagD (HAD superfamily)
LGNKCFHVTWGARGAVSVEGLGLELVPSPAEADFILAHGTEAVGGSEGSSPVELEALRQTLERAARESGETVPLLCANPDIVTVNGAAGLVTMPGTLARWYAGAGGRVVLLGKPGPAIYSAAAALLLLEEEAASEPTREQRRFPLLAIGDSLEHDIAGARGAPCPAEGVESLFIGGGIHAEELKLGTEEKAEAGESLNAGALERLLASRPAAQRPTLAMSWYRV